jgi:gliding motility-associated-like protein
MKRRLIFLILTLAAMNVNLNAQYYLNVYCSVVNDDGSVTLTYSTSEVTAFLDTVTDVFDHYMISVFGLGDTYVPTDYVNDSSIGTYTVTGVNANNSQQNFLVTARVYVNGRMDSIGERHYGSIKTIYLTAIEVNETTIQLNWTSQGGGFTGSEGNKYMIYRRIAKEGNWVLIDSTTSRTYTDNINPVCSDTISYQISIASSYGCESKSNKYHLVIGDTERPDMPNILNSSVDLTSQQLVITWTPSTANDVNGYRVCTYNPYSLLADINSASASSYVCNTCDVATKYDIYVMSYDTCDNTSLRTETISNMVLNLQHAECSDQVSISWNPYYNMYSGISFYKIRHSTDGINFTDIKTCNSDTPNGTVQINTTQNEHWFYVTAFRNPNDSANSNMVKLTIPPTKELSFIDIRSCSVLESNMQIALTFFSDTSTTIANYKLLRSRDGSPFEVVKTLPYEGKATFSYTDNLPQSAERSIYRYIMQSSDACGLIYKNSATAQSVKLSIDGDQSVKTNLQWTSYGGWASVQGYEIYKRSGSGMPYEYIGTSYSNTYEDYGDPTNQGGDITTYHVVAMENGVGKDGTQASASSSYASQKSETLIFTPNCFTPKGGQNTIFKPQLSGAKKGSYEMRIYNRYGQLLFYSNDISLGWDGTFEGQYVQVGVYVFIITYQDADSQQQSKRGTVMLLD